MSDAAILGGGRGSRLGGACKPLLEIDGVAILDRQLASIAPAVDRIAVVAPDPEPLARPGVTALRDPGRGPLAALVVALEWCATERLVAIAGDMPLVTAAAIALLESSAGDADLVGFEIGGRVQPLLALYRPAAVLAAARELAAAGAGPSALFARAGLGAVAIAETTCRAELGDLDFAAGVNDAADLARVREIAAKP